MKQKIISLCILTFFSYSCNNQKIVINNGYAITNITIIDPIEGVSEKMTIIIIDNRIAQLDKSKNINLSNTNIIYDGTGKYIIPGLWDFHVHFSFIKDLAPSMFNLFLGYGITSVRDTGGELEFVQQWKQKSIKSPNISPRVKIAGPLIDGEKNVYDGSSNSYPKLSIQNKDEDAIKANLEFLYSFGIDFFKAYEMLSPEQFLLVTSYAKEKNMKVTGHVPLSMDVSSAIDAGLNSMEHLRNLELSISTDSDELFNQRNEILCCSDILKGSVLRSNIHNLQRMPAVSTIDTNRMKLVFSKLAENEVSQIPTLNLYHGFSNYKFLDKNWSKSFNYLPLDISNKWKSEINNFRSSKPNENSQAFSKWMMNMVFEMRKYNIEFISGTDTPIGYQTPGYSLHDELSLLSKSGLSNLEVIYSATYAPAKYFNMEDSLGAIQRNRIADLIILNNNPIEDIENTKDIWSVIKNGNYFDRLELDSLLNSQRPKNF